MSRRLALLISASAACLMLLPVGSALARSVKPKITYVTPMRVSVGGRLTVRGRRFSRHRLRDTLILRGPNRRVLFLKPRRASARKLVVIVPSSVERLLNVSGGSRSATRVRMRVAVRRRFGRWTRSRTSPVVVPFATPSIGGSSSGGGSSGGSAPPAPSCGSGSDWDGDLLSNSTETSIGTDPCLKDTDGDGVQDGFEYRSARDLNDDESQNPNTYLPYPGKRPYPNPLDPTDGNVDYDGDSLTSREEQKLWLYSIANGAARTLSPLTYSAGEQYSVYTRGVDGRRQPALAAAGYSKQVSFLNWATAAGYRQVMLSDGSPWYSGSTQNLYGLLDFNRDGTESSSVLPGYRQAENTYYDRDQNGFLSDDERDEDADGLSNYDELHGPMMGPSWWSGCYTSELHFPVSYAGTSATNPDSDGDGIRDGADDQDHDDIPNVMELGRIAASGLDDRKRTCVAADGLPTPPATNHPNAYGRVNPFNPCLPATWSRTCPRIIPFGTSFAPFDDSLDWASLN